MPDILLVILAVVFVLGIAINIHEFGHFIVAKWLGMRVEAYSFFGLGPRIWGFKVGHTDYRISAIPLGAYVKLYGDEETSDLHRARLMLVDATRVVLANGLDLLGVSAPERM